MTTDPTIAKIGDYKHGDKSIILKVLFHANEIDNPKLAWTTGKIYIKTNKSRGIRCDANPTPFNSIEEIVPTIMRELKKYNIDLLESDRKIVDKKKYLKKIKYGVTKCQNIQK